MCSHKAYCQSQETLALFQLWSFAHAVPFACMDNSHSFFRSWFSLHYLTVLGKVS